MSLKGISYLKKDIMGIQDKLSKGDHVFYYVEDNDCYITNAVSYIKDGIEQGDQILFVENERSYPKILERLEALFTEEQLKNVHYINNFTFYWRNGNFHPPTILEYFSTLIDPFLEKEMSFRTWGHIEWRDDIEISKSIQEYEFVLERLVPEKNAISVCAYDAERLSNSLKQSLLNCHGLYMTDDSIAPITK